MFSELWQITVYTKKSPGIQLRSIPPLSHFMSESRVGLCAQETTSHFPSFHVWNFSCARHASSTLYSLSWIHKWRMGYKFSTWCHWSGTCYKTTIFRNWVFPAVGFKASICLQLKVFTFALCFKGKYSAVFKQQHFPFFPQNQCI